MAITIDNDSRFIDYQVQESATSLNPGDSSTQFGRLDYTRPKETFLDDVTTLLDSRYGTYPARVSSVTKSEGLYSVTADDAFSGLNKWLTVKPYAGTLAGYLTRLKNTANLSYPFTTSVSRNVVCPGFRGNVWAEFNKFLSAQDLEAAQVDGGLVVRLPRQSTASLDNEITSSLSADDQSTSQYVTVPYFQMRSNTIQSQIAVFPNRRSVEDMQFAPITVEPGETVVQQITLQASLSSVNQPEVMDYVAASTTGEGTNGMYCVVDSEGKPIPAAAWTNGGGRLRVRLTDDPSIIEVIVTASRITDFGSYRIAAGVGSTSDSHYNSLRVTGTGLRWDEDSVTMHTGAPNNTEGEDSTTTVDNRFILTRAAAWTAAIKASSALCGGVPSLSGSFVPEPGEKFGTLAGSRIRRDGNYFRISETTFTPSNVQFNSKSDVLVSDFNSFYGTMVTVGGFNALFQGMTVGDFNRKVMQQ